MTAQPSSAGVLFTGISQLVTPPAAGPIHGRAMRELDIIDNAAIAVRNGIVTWVGAASHWTGEAASIHHCGGRAVVPGLIDPHTHAIWAGDRLADFEARVSGVSYEAILARGGGIRSTIRHTAAATEAELAALAQPRLLALAQSGATTVEVKSGYGFSVDAELRMLQVIRQLTHSNPIRLVPTLLIHIPPIGTNDREPYLDEVKASLIPQAAARQLATAIDIFIEREAWSAAEAAALISCARRHGLAAKLHTEQFHRVGGLELGLQESVLSVDHLEAAAPEQFAALAQSSTLATILPGVTLHLGIPPANGRGLIDAGAAVAVGTDLNPGSSPLYSTAAALALAVRLNGLTPAEALTAGTVNAAAALGLADRGRLFPGTRADLLILQSHDWRDLVYTLGANPVRDIFIGSERLSL